MLPSPLLSPLALGDAVYDQPTMDDLLSPEVLQVMRRKISRQKLDTDRRTAQFDDEPTFESSPPLRSPMAFSSALNTDVFHPPNTRKVTRVLSKENYSLANGRPVQSRSASASALDQRSNDPPSAGNDEQRLKNVRRHEPVHGQSKSSLIRPDSWRTDPVILKKPAKKKTKPNSITKSESLIDQPPARPSTVPKRSRSASKPSERAPKKPVPKAEKTKEEKEMIKKYMDQKRLERDDKRSKEKRSKSEQETQRKAKLKKLDEQIKKVAQQLLPAPLNKHSSGTPEDSAEPNRQRIIDLLGPKPFIEILVEDRPSTPPEPPAVRERSPSSDASDSVVEIQPPVKYIEPVIQPSPVQNSRPSNDVDHRRENLLQWAVNLTRNCAAMEDKMKYIRPDGAQPFDLIPPSSRKYDDGNLRHPPLVHLQNDRKEKLLSKFLRSSGRLSHLNQNHASEYQGQSLPGVGDLRDPALEQRIRRDRAAARIQSVYRGYTVRKSLQWIHEEKLPHPQIKHHRRPMKSSSYKSDLVDMPSISQSLRMSDDQFTFGSTLLRHYRLKDTHPVASPAVLADPAPRRPVSRTYSDGYENPTSTASSTRHKTPPEKPRIIQQVAPHIQSTSSSTSSSPTRESPGRSLISYRRPIPPSASPSSSSSSSSQSVAHPPLLPVTTVHQRSEERRYSPGALERQLNAELHLLDGVEASMKQIENMERLRSVTLAQQEVVSLAQVLKNKPAVRTAPQPSRRKSSSSSSVSTHTSKRPRPIQPSHSPSSSESTLPAREKRVRPKFHSDLDLQTYERRLKTIEKKIHLLGQHDVVTEDERLETADKPKVVSARNPIKPDHDSSISEDLPPSRSSTIRTVQRKSVDETSEIHTETSRHRKEDDKSSVSSPQKSETITSDASDIERRLRTYREQLQAKKTELDQLKRQKGKEALRRQEDDLKKQIQTYDHEIKTLRTLPVPVKVSTENKFLPPIHRSLSPSSSSSTSSQARKPQESSIVEDLPAPSTATPSKQIVVVRSPTRPVVAKDRDFFDDEEEEDVKPFETPRDERDTHNDALSISTATDLAASSNSELNSHRPILNFSTKLAPQPISKQDSPSSSSSSSPAHKKVSVVKDYDEDFSDATHSPVNTSREPIAKTARILPADIESIQEDLDRSKSLQDTNRSSASRSGDEQSEILVLGKKSATNTPRRMEEDTVVRQVESQPDVDVQNEDTSHDISEDEEVNERLEQEKKIDRLTDSLIRSFIDEAIDHGKELGRLKHQTRHRKAPLTKAAQEWISDDNSSSSDDEDESSSSRARSNEFDLDLSPLDDRNSDEHRLESPGRIIIEEPVQPLVPHTSSQVSDLCHQALDILLDRSTSTPRIPDSSYYTYNQPDDADDNLQRNHRAYCQMVFDLCAEVLREVSTEPIQPAKYSDWQKSKLISKRFYVARKMTDRREIEAFVQRTVLEVLHFQSRPIVYSKWRVTTGRVSTMEKYELVLDEEIRRSESQWTRYDDASNGLKLEIADSIFEQLVQETFSDCFRLFEQRLAVNSHSTRL